MRNSYLIPIALLCCSLLLSIDVNRAFAAGFTLVDYGGGQVPDSITRQGSFIFVGSVASDNVKVFNANTQALVTTIAGVTDPEALYIGTDATRVYSFDSDGALIEIDAVNHAVLRSLSPGCSGSTGTVANNFLYCATAGEVVHKINLATMATAFSSTTLNAGATPCDTIQGLSYDSDSDIMFAGCNASNRVVSVEAFLVSGTPDFAYAYTGARLLAWNEDNTNLLICSASVARQLVDYTQAVGFSGITTIGDATGTCNATPHLTYHSNSNRFIMETAASTETLDFIDASDGTQLYSQALSGASNAEQVFAYSNEIVYGTRANTDDWFIFDTSGIPLGSGGTPDDTTGLDCTLPENANILICRLGGDCDNGTVLGCVGDTVLGNSTDDSDTGLIDVICGVGFIDCNANPDIKTNGIGYLLLAVALGIEIGILWVASRGDLRQIPTFIWFTATIAIIAALTLFNWIDGTMLVLGVIIAVALAAAKARGFFGGDSF